MAQAASLSGPPGELDEASLEEDEDELARGAEPDDEHSTRHKISAFLKKNLERGKEKGLDEFGKQKQKLQHLLGLGRRPSVIPPGEVDIRGEPRAVEIGWHPVAGFAGRWFAEQTGLGRMITEKTRQYPDPTQHWGVLVGDYVHELWMDEHFHVIYIDEKIVPEGWQTFMVGKTRFNDEALRQAGKMVIHAMRSTRPAYNLIDNNCQNFATRMLDAIQVGNHRQFATSFAVYQRAVGRGSIQELFVDDHPDEEPALRPDTPPEGTVPLAQQVMDSHTNKLQRHDSWISG